MELSSSNINKFLIFFKKKAYFIFRETETPKRNFLILQQRKTFRAQIMKKAYSKKMFYISKNETFHPEA